MKYLGKNRKHMQRKSYLYKCQKIFNVKLTFQIRILVVIYTVTVKEQLPNIIDERKKILMHSRVQVISSSY